MLPAALLAACGAGGAEVEGDHVRVRLVSEQAAVTPGRPFWAGLLQTLDDGWHTYWRNPGDSGAAARIDWRLPAGWTASPVQWPTPERMPYGTLMNYGYAGEVLLPVVITPPADAGRGRVELAADALWLVCADVCIPGEASLRLTVRVRPQPDAAPGDDGPAPGGAESGDAAAGGGTPLPLFDRWRARIPRPVDGARVERRGRRLTITAPVAGARDAREVWFFPHAAGAIAHAAEQEHAVTAGGAVEVRVQAADGNAAGRLSGVVAVTTDRSTRGFSIDAPVREAAQADEADGQRPAGGR